MGYSTSASAPKSKLVRQIDRKLTNVSSIISSIKDGTVEGIDSNGVAYTKDVCKFEFSFPQLADKNFDYIANLDVNASAKRIVDEFWLMDNHKLPRVRKDSFEAKNIILAISNYDVATKTQVPRYADMDAYYNSTPELKGSLIKLYAIFAQQEQDFEYILNPEEFIPHLTGREVHVSTYISKGKAFVTSPAFDKVQSSNKATETTNRKVARGLWS